MIVELPILPEGYSIRKIQYSDYHNGVLTTLATLTTVGDISEREFNSVVETWNSSRGLYNVYVIVNQSDEVVAIGTIIVELKLIHKCGKVGHIEDISVRSDRSIQTGIFLLTAHSGISIMPIVYVNHLE